MKKPSLDSFTKVSGSTGGNASAMAQAFGCTRRTIYNWMEEDTKFKEAFDDARESLIDFVESQALTLMKGIPRMETVIDEHSGVESVQQVGWNEKPDTAIIIFNLKTRGKTRGYIERSEITGKDGKDLMPALDRLTPDQLNQLRLMQEAIQPE